MNDNERQELREWSARKMGWIPPESLPDGKYIEVLENEELWIGCSIGWRHTETGRFYTNKEFEKYQYWRTTDGEPAKAPWGGLIYKDTFYKWRPDNPSTGQIWLLVEKMRELGFTLTLESGHKPETYIAHFGSVEGRSNNPCIAILKAARATVDYGMEKEDD